MDDKIKHSRQAIRTRGTQNIKELIERGKQVARSGRGTAATEKREKRKEISPNEERESKQARKGEGEAGTSDSEAELEEEKEAFKRSAKVKRSPVESKEEERSKKEEERAGSSEIVAENEMEQPKTEITMAEIWSKLGEMVEGINNTNREIKEMRTVMEARWKAVDEKVENLGVEMTKKIEDMGEEQEERRKRGEEDLKREIEEERE